MEATTMKLEIDDEVTDGEARMLRRVLRQSRDAMRPVVIVLPWQWAETARDGLEAERLTQFIRHPDQNDELIEPLRAVIGAMALSDEENEGNPR